MLVPLYGFVAGDSMGVVVLVQHSDLVEELAHVLAQACEVRVRPVPRFVVLKAGVRLDPAVTISEAGLVALDRVDLAPDGDT